MGNTLRFMRPQDKTEIINLLDSVSQFKPFELTVAKELVEDCLSSGASSNYCVLVVEDKGKVAGYICYGRAPLTESTWDIYWEAVTFKRQGCGIGTALLMEAEKNIRLLGGKLVLIETSSTAQYEKTRKFYLSNGYKQVSCIVDYYAPGDDRVTYFKKLE